MAAVAPSPAGRHQLRRRLLTDVAGGEQSWLRSIHAQANRNVTGVVQGNQVCHRSGIGLQPHIDEQAADRFHRLAVGVAHPQPGDGFLAQHFHHLGVVAHLDFRFGGNAILEDLLRVQGVSPVEQDHPLNVFGQRQCLVSGGVAATHDGDGLAHVHRAIAGGAVGDATTEKFLFARDAQGPERRTGGHYHGLAEIAFSHIPGDSEVITLHGYASDSIHQHFHAGVHRLFLGCRSEFVAGDALGEAGIVFDTFQVDDLRSGHHLLNNGGGQSVSGSVDPGGQAGHAAADDDYVVVLFRHLNYLIAGW